MASLLTLPCELRTLILEYTLSATHDTPSSPWTSPSRKELDDFRHLMNIWPGRSILYERKSPQPNSLPLLLTNHQLSAETAGLIHRANDQTKPDYALDVVVFNEFSLYPTWLSLPWLTNRVSTLNVAVRTAGHLASAKEAKRQFGCGGRMGVHWHFYALLKRFLKYGPVGEKIISPAEKAKSPRNKYPFQDRDVTIDHLVMDFSNAETEYPLKPEGTSDSIWSYRGCQEGDKPRRESYAMRPEALCKWLYDELRELLEMGYHHANYGAFLYSSVGKITMRVDGEVYGQFDLARMLAGLRFEKETDTMGHLCQGNRLDVFWGWKRRTLERRERIGLPVVWPEDPELRREGVYILL